MSNSQVIVCKTDYEKSIFTGVRYLKVLLVLYFGNLLMNLGSSVQWGSE